MKRLFTLIVAISSILAVMAQNPMVTLDHNGELKFFTNARAFQDAYEAAEQGDIIYLSEGVFILNDKECGISKRLSIIGSGYGSHILGTIKFQGGSFDKSVMNTPLFDGVRIDNLIFYCNPSELGETEIIRCWIGEITNGDSAGSNVTYDKCYLESIHISTGIGAGNVVLKNSKIGNMINGYNVTTINCNIKETNYYPAYMLSSILCMGVSPEINASINPIAKNSLFLYDLTSDKVTFDNCYTYNMNLGLVDDKLNTLVDLVRYGYSGIDGTEVGIRGGESPFSENPSLPTVDTSKSSVEYDAAGNKLKVSISVKAD